MITVGAFEAKTHLSRLIEQVMEGEQVTITRHGVPVAKIVGINETEKSNPSEAIARLRELSKSAKLNGLTIKELIAEGRKH
jgi:prevent-host-death family protein